MDMDPTVVMKLVREQKRQISDSYGTSANGNPHANSMKNASTTGSNNNSHTFQLPPPPPPPPPSAALYHNNNNSNHHQQQQQQQQPIRNRASLHQPQGTYHNSGAMLNNNGLKSNDNKIYYINYNNNGNDSKEVEYMVESSSKSVHKPTSHNVYVSPPAHNLKPNGMSVNEYEYYHNNANAGYKNQYYYQQQLQSSSVYGNSAARQTPPNIIVDAATISRSGSVKSVASDSGVGSSSPLSDCSDYGAQNPSQTNPKLSNHNSNNNGNKSSQMGEIILVGAHNGKSSVGFKPPLNSPKAHGTSLSPNVNNINNNNSNNSSKSFKNGMEPHVPSVSPVAAALTATSINNNSLPGKKRKSAYDDPVGVVFVDPEAKSQPQANQAYANAKQQNAQQQQLNHLYNQAAAAAAAHHQQQQFYHNNHNYPFAHQMNSHEAQSPKAQLSKPCNMPCCVPVKPQQQQPQQQHTQQHQQQQQFMQPGLVNYNGKSNQHQDVNNNSNNINNNNNNNNNNMNDVPKPGRPRGCNCKDCCGEIKYLDKKGGEGLMMKSHQATPPPPPPPAAHGHHGAFNSVQPIASCCDCPSCKVTAVAAKSSHNNSLTPPSSVPKIPQPVSPASLSVNTQATPNRFIISPNSSFSPVNGTNGSSYGALKTPNDAPYPHHYPPVSPRYSEIDYRNVKQPQHEQKQMMYDVGVNKGQGHVHGHGQGQGQGHAQGQGNVQGQLPPLPPPPPLPQHMMPNVNFCNCADCLKANRIDSDLSKAAAVAAAAVIAAQHQHQQQQQMHHNKSMNLVPKPIKPLPMNGMYNMNDQQQFKSKSTTSMKLNKTSSPLPLEAALTQTNTTPSCLANEYSDLLVNGHHIIKQKNNILNNYPGSPYAPQEQLMKLKRKHSYGDIAQDVAAVAKMNLNVNKPVPIAPNPMSSSPQQQQHHAYQPESYSMNTAARPPSKKYKTSSIDKPLTPFIVAAPLVGGNQHKSTSANDVVINGENGSGVNLNVDEASASVAAATVAGKPTSLVCLAVNKPKLNENERADDEEEIELGEVVSIEKLKNTSAELINFDGCPTTFANFSKTDKQINSNDRQIAPPVATATADAPVTISKKVLPIVTRCVCEWLEKSVELVYKIGAKSDDVDFDALFCVLHKAWPRVLLIYMIENSFDYCVTKDSLTTSNESSSSPSPSTNDEETKKDDNDDSGCSKNSHKLPREKDALQFNDIITKGHAFNLNSHEYDLLRELIIYREGSDDSTFNRPYLKAQLNFQETIESSHGKQHFSKLLHFMPNIYNTNVDIIESLFCRSLNNFKSVQELFNKKLRSLLVDEEEKQSLSNSNNNNKNQHHDSDHDHDHQAKSPSTLSGTESNTEKPTVRTSSPNIQISSDEQSHISSPRSQQAVSTPASTPTPSASPATTVKNNSESVPTRENNIN